MNENIELTYEIDFKAIFTKDIKKNIYRNANIFMKQLCLKISNEELTLENVDTILKKIIDDMGCMRYAYASKENKLIIHYNSKVDILVTETKVQLIRNLKLKKILK